MKSSISIAVSTGTCCNICHILLLRIINLFKYFICVFPYISIPQSGVNVQMHNRSFYKSQTIICIVS